MGSAIPNFLAVVKTLPQFRLGQVDCPRGFALHFIVYSIDIPFATRGKP
jgi:hypothetical protein